MASSDEVQSAQYDLPSEIEGIPEFGIVEPESDHILPQLLDVGGVGSQDLDVGASRGAQVGGELVERGAG